MTMGYNYTVKPKVICILELTIECLKGWKPLSKSYCIKALKQVIKTMKKNMYKK